jgi:hypothetical protein
VNFAFVFVIILIVGGAILQLNILNIKESFTSNTLGLQTQTQPLPITDHALTGCTNTANCTLDIAIQNHEPAGIEIQNVTAKKLDDENISRTWNLGTCNTDGLKPEREDIALEGKLTCKGVKFSSPLEKEVDQPYELEIEIQYRRHDTHLQKKQKTTVGGKIQQANSRFRVLDITDREVTLHNYGTDDLALASVQHFLQHRDGSNRVEIGQETKQQTFQDGATTTYNLSQSWESGPGERTLDLQFGDTTRTQDVDAGLSSLKAAWQMDINKGTNVPGAVNGNNGTYNGETFHHGTLESNPQWVSGKFGQALEFDGNDDFVSANTSGLTELTITAWIYRDTNNNWHAISSRGDFSDDTRNWVLEGVNDEDKVRLNMEDTSNSFHNIETPSGSLPTEEWVHVAGTYDGSTMKIYLDGVLEASSDDAFTPKTADVPGAIGAALGGTDHFFDGKLDDVRIYNRSLSNSEVADIADHNVFIRRKIIGHWRFDEGSGNFANDTHHIATDDNTNSTKFGNALTFDGDDDYVEVPDDSSLDITDAITIAIWVKGEPGGDWPRLVEKGENDAYELFGGNNNGTSFDPWMRINGNDLHRGQVTGLPTDKWVHLVGTYDSSTGESALWVDGKLRNTDSISPQSIDTTGQTLRIGTEEPLRGPDKWNGSIDEVQLYDQTLTDQQIKRIAKEPYLVND